LTRPPFAPIASSPYMPRPSAFYATCTYFFLVIFCRETTTYFFCPWLTNIFIERPPIPTELGSSSWVGASPVQQ
jgi:hypothetical protein